MSSLHCFQTGKVRQVITCSTSTCCLHLVVSESPLLLDASACLEAQNLNAKLLSCQMSHPSDLPLVTAEMKPPPQDLLSAYIWSEITANMCTSCILRKSRPWQPTFLCQSAPINWTEDQPDRPKNVHAETWPSVQAVKWQRTLKSQLLCVTMDPAWSSPDLLEMMPHERSSPASSADPGIKVSWWAWARRMPTSVMRPSPRGVS